MRLFKKKHELLKWIMIDREGIANFPMLIPERNALKVTQVEILLETRLIFDGKNILFQNPERPKEKLAYII